MIACLKSEDIDATLKYGQIFAGKAWNRVFLSVYILSGVVFAFIIFMLIGIPLTLGEYDENSIITIVFCSCVTALLLLLSILIQLYFRSGKKKVDVWLQDAVLLKAKTVSRGERLLFRGFMVRTAVVIEVDFTYDNRRHIRQSMRREEPLYLPVYLKHINKTITIAYSPKYDEVMLIKPKSLLQMSNS